VPKLLVTGGRGHSTAHLYNSVKHHPAWRLLPAPDGRCEAEVLRDLLFALGVAEGQLLPLELDSLNCGGNAECSMRLAVEREGMRPARIIVVQVGACNACGHACVHACVCTHSGKHCTRLYAPTRARIKFYTHTRARTHTSK
jgi:hypothetical protein